MVAVGLTVRGRLRSGTRSASRVNYPGSAGPALSDARGAVDPRVEHRVRPGGVVIPEAGVEREVGRQPEAVPVGCPVEPVPEQLGTTGRVIRPPGVDRDQVLE